MASAEITVTMHMNTVLSRHFVRLMQVLGPVIVLFVSEEGFVRWVGRVAARLLLVKFDNGHWRFAR